MTMARVAAPILLFGLAVRVPVVAVTMPWMLLAISYDHPAVGVVLFLAGVGLHVVAGRLVDWRVRSLMHARVGADPADEALGSSRVLTPAVPHLLAAAAAVAVVPVWQTLVAALAVAAVYHACFVLVLLGVWVVGLRAGAGRNLDALERRLELESSGLFRGGFRSIRLVAYDDLWKATVGRLVAWCDVVLMDLRGFDVDRRGCAYEVGYLLRHRSLDDVVFLLDDTTDDALFRHTVRSAWEASAGQRPATRSDEPAVHVYRAGPSLRADLRPLFAVMGELVTSRASTDGEAPVAAARAPASPESRAVTAGLVVAWLVVLAGVVRQAVWGGDGAELGSGMSIVWVGGMGVALARRARAVLVREGDLAQLFHNPLWSLVMGLSAGGWLLWYFGRVD
ncbi:MAG: hypothetical protein H6732_13370 [Alphaproteobacteria bacterium]|nr:hypothetical protein [Alphaproteobacteria bacterium]